MVDEGAADAVVVKPADMSVEPPHAPREGSVAAPGDRTLLGWARRRWPQAMPRLPHRLDRIARGFVVVALTPEAAAFHSAMVAARRWTKIYLVRVAIEGDPQVLLGPQRGYLRRRGRRAEIVRAGGDPARQEVLVTAAAPGRAGEAHALVRLETGRFHQIRLLMAHARAPLAGDPLYDPDAAARGISPWLEHALLRMPRFGAESGELATYFRGDDPAREPVAAAIAEALAGLARDG